MDDENEPQSGPPQRPPARTEQLRIVGAEEAGALMGQANRGGPEGGAGASGSGRESAENGRRAGPDDDLDDDGDDRDDYRDDGFGDDVVPGGRRPRSVFESIPDAPSSFLDEMAQPDDPSGDVTRAVPSSGSPGRSDRGSGAPRSTRGQPTDDADDDNSAWLSSLSEPDHHPDQRDETDPNRFGTVPVVRVERGDPDDASSEGLAMPHWTEPPTGQVPKVLAADEERRDDDSWSTFGASPRWRDPSTEWDAEDYSDVSDLADDLPREGALDEGDRPSLDEFFSFDDLEPAAAARRREPVDDPSEPVSDPSPRTPVSSRRPSGSGNGGGGEGQMSSSAAPPRNMGIAVGAGVTLGVVALLLLRWGPGPTMVLVTLAVGIAAAELLATARRVGYHPAALVGLAASAGLPLAVYWRGEAAYPLVLFLAVAFTLFWYLFGVDTERPAQSAGITVLAIGYVGVLGSFAALILRNGSPLGTNTLLAIILPTVAADIGALVVGQNAGRSPLSPVSPNKTVEGALGGFGAAVVVSVLFNHFILDLQPFDGLWDSIALGVVIGIVALLGDLCESLLKRSFGVKDMGTIIPGHGGVLDRFDALLFALPSAYYLARLLDLLPPMTTGQPTVAILGSTGSIGTQTVDVVRQLAGGVRVVALGAGRSVELLAAQADELRPEVVVVGDAAGAAALAGRLPAGTELAVGPEALAHAATVADIVVNAVVGFAGLGVTLASIGAGRRLALANKESLIAAGPVVRRHLAEHPEAELVPVDSEHSAIHQCLRGGRPAEVARLLLTASGGPFRGRTCRELAAVTVEDALAHPTWKMGPKITVDSSTLMNKGLEVIEAHELFGLDYGQIEVVVHPQSIVHSMVEFCDGSTMAQLSRPDMRLPIGYALGWPDRHPAPHGRIDWATLGQLDFERPDLDAFPCLALAYEAGRLGGTAPAALSAANEVAVEAFLAGRIPWMVIAETCKATLARHDGAEASTAADVIAADARARALAREELLRHAA